MRKFSSSAFTFGVAAVLLGLLCSGCRKGDAQKSASKQLDQKAAYEMTPVEIGLFVGKMQESIPDLQLRVAAVAQRSLGQPYKISLLGEFPFEIRDSGPLYCLESGDCVVCHFANQNQPLICGSKPATLRVSCS